MTLNEFKTERCQRKQNFKKRNRILKKKTNNKIKKD